MRKWQSIGQRPKLGIWFMNLPLVGDKALLEPALLLTLPHKQCEELAVFQTIQRLIRERN